MTKSSVPSYDGALDRYVAFMHAPKDNADFLAPNFMYEEFFGVVHLKDDFLKLLGKNGMIQIERCSREDYRGAFHGNTCLVTMTTKWKFKFQGESKEETFHSFLVFQYGPQGWLWLGGQNHIRPKIRMKAKSSKT